MYEILHDLHINAKPSQVYSLISTPGGLNKWWTKEAEGKAKEGNKFRFFFSKKYDWSGIVTRCQDKDYIQWKMVECDDDWDDTYVGFELFPKDGGTLVSFHHRNWKIKNDHYRRTNYCWALYLRLMKKYLEDDEFVPYDHRIDA